MIVGLALRVLLVVVLLVGVYQQSPIALAVSVLLFVAAAEYFAFQYQHLTTIMQNALAVMERVERNHQENGRKALESCRLAEGKLVELHGLFNAWQAGQKEIHRFRVMPGGFSQN